MESHHSLPPLGQFSSTALRGRYKSGIILLILHVQFTYSWNFEQDFFIMFHLESVDFETTNTS